MDNINGDRILGELIGLIGAVQNNGKTDDTDNIIVSAVLSMDNGDDSEVIDKVVTEKYRISPSCKTCVSPCGNTASFDISKLSENSHEVYRIKLELIEEIKKYVRINNSINDDITKAISYIKYDLPYEMYDELLGKIREK